MWGPSDTAWTVHLVSENLQMVTGTQLTDGYWIVPFLWVSSTIVANISVLNGVFLIIGLASDPHKPSTTTVTKGLQVGDKSSAMLWIQAISIDCFFNCWSRSYKISYVYTGGTKPGICFWLEMASQHVSVPAASIYKKFPRTYFLGVASARCVAVSLVASWLNPSTLFSSNNTHIPW